MELVTVGMLWHSGPELLALTVRVCVQEGGGRSLPQALPLVLSPFTLLQFNLFP